MLFERNQLHLDYYICFFVAPHIFTNVMFVGSRGRGLVILPTCTVVGGMMRLPFMIACMQLRFGSDLSHLTLLLLIYFRVLAWMDFHQP